MKFVLKLTFLFASSFLLCGDTLAESFSSMGSRSADNDQNFGDGALIGIKPSGAAFRNTDTIIGAAVTATAWKQSPTGTWGRITLSPSLSSMSGDHILPEDLQGQLQTNVKSFGVSAVAIHGFEADPALQNHPYLVVGDPLGLASDLPSETRRTGNVQIFKETATGNYGFFMKLYPSMFTQFPNCGIPSVGGGVPPTDSGIGADNAQFGYSIERGDVNNDGIEDVLIGVPEADSSRPGQPGDIIEDTGKVLALPGDANGGFLTPFCIGNPVLDDDSRGDRFGEQITVAQNPQINAVVQADNLIFIAAPGQSIPNSFNPGSHGAVHAIRAQSATGAQTSVLSLYGGDRLERLGEGGIEVINIDGTGMAEIVVASPSYPNLGLPASGGVFAYQADGSNSRNLIEGGIAANQQLGYSMDYGEKVHGQRGQLAISDLNAQLGAGRVLLRTPPYNFQDQEWTFEELQSNLNGQEVSLVSQGDNLGQTIKYLGHLPGEQKYRLAVGAPGANAATSNPGRVAIDSAFKDRACGTNSIDKYETVSVSDAVRGADVRIEGSYFVPDTSVMVSYHLDAECDNLENFISTPMDLDEDLTFEGRTIRWKSRRIVGTPGCKDNHGWVPNHPEFRLYTLLGKTGTGVALHTQVLQTDTNGRLNTSFHIPLSIPAGTKLCMKTWTLEPGQPHITSLPLTKNHLNADKHTEIMVELVSGVLVKVRDPDPTP